MRTQEIVVGNEQRGKSYSAICTVESGSRSHVILERPVEPFDQLLKGSKLFRLGIKVLQADHLLVADFRRVKLLRIEEMDPSGIRGVTISNESDLLTVSSGTDSFPHSDHSRQGSPVVSNVVSRDFEGFAGDEEEHVMVFAQHLNVGLITGADVIDTPFMPEVKAMTVPGGTGCIIEHSLM